MMDHPSPRTMHVSCGVLVHPDDRVRRSSCGTSVRLLMGLRKSTGTRPSLWEFPGGQQERTDRGPRFALAREWKEELGIEINVRERIATGIIDADVRVMIEMFEVMTPDICLIKMNDHDDLRWVTLDNAVRHLPCSPAFFVHFPFLDLWIRRFVSGSVDA